MGYFSLKMREKERFEVKNEKIKSISRPHIVKNMPEIRDFGLKMRIFLRNEPKFSPNGLNLVKNNLNS